MAKISLRAYYREIEKLIDTGQTDEAIAHCRHILQTHAKHVGTYRLLGKAFLETQRYGDAADILQRVLSANPEDFISHLGMSIVREDEGNLDEAIWHMERAFEIQPANAAIQDELRRLYGRRDGLEPHKIHLTRGALARMYARGNLYQQAIGELRAALNEDPQRPDLQTVLARMYVGNGQRIEAAEICKALLTKFPNCMEANRIMAEILTDTGRAEEAKAYRQRLLALEPYSAFLVASIQTVDQVPENAVTLDRLDWSPDQPTGVTSSQPEWASSLGIKIDEFTSEEEKIPQWLNQAEEAPPGAEASEPLPDKDTLPTWVLEEQKPEITTPATEDQIPEWMKSAGWVPSSGEVQEQKFEFPVEDEEKEIPVSDEPLARAEIPEWLRAIAPADSTEEIDQTKPITPPVSWQNLEPVSAEEPLLATDGAHVELPDWLKELAPIPTSEAQPDKIRDLFQMSEEKEAELQPADEASPFPTVGQPEVLPWQLEEPETPEPIALEALAAEQPEQPEGPAQGLLIWLEEAKSTIIEPAEKEPLTVQPEPEPVELEKPQLPIELVESETTGEETKERETAELVAHEWQEPEVEVTLPEWMQTLSQETPVEAGLSDLGETEKFEATLPDWLSEALGGPGAVAGLGSGEGFEPPAWLVEAQQQETQIPAEGPGLQEPAPPASAGFPEILPFAGEKAPDALPDQEEDTFAWLESLAARQGALEEELLTKPEERPSEIPSWIKESADEVSAETPLLMAEEMVSAKGSGEFEPTEAISAPEIPGIAEPATIPDWLLEIQAEQIVAEGGAPVEDESAAMPELSAVELPDWLTIAQPTEELTLSEPVAAEPAVIPDWLLGIAAVESEAAIEAMQEPADQPAVMPFESELPVETAAQPEIEISQPEAAVEMPAAAVSDTQPVRLHRETLQPAAFEPVAIAPAELSQPEVSITAEETPPSMLSLEDESAAMAWLESLAARQGALEEELLTKPEDRLEQPPEWVQMLAASEAAAALEKAEPEPVLAEEPVLAPAEPVLAAEIPAEPVGEVAAVGVEEFEQPEWLLEIEAEPAISEAAPASVEPASVLRAAEAEVLEMAEVGGLPSEELAEGPGPLSLADETAALAWLESLALRQGAQEDELLTRPEDRLDQPPDWIRQTVPTEAAGLPEPVSVVPMPPAEEAAPEKIFEVQAETGVITPEVEARPELPDWLSSYAQPEPQEEETWRPPTEVEPVPELPDWAAVTHPAVRPVEPPLEKIDLNSASLAQLERLPGIGFILAQKIVTYRDTFGAFKSFTDLRRISGVDQGTLAELQQWVILTAPLEAEPVKPVQDIGPISNELMQARNSLMVGSLNESLGIYEALIKTERFLPDIIQDLRQAISHQPRELALYQTLGDAYVRNNQLREALDTYMQAEELLR